VEAQTTENVSMWAQRVDKATFDRVAAEKQSSGMVVNDILGRKTRGVLEPQFDTPVPGGAITEWSMIWSTAVMRCTGWTR
jgi:hypothetical protein